MTKKLSPTKMSLEKWMRVPMGSSMTLFTFSGFAQFVWGQDPLIGVGSNNSEEQKVWQTYHIKEFVVGPHWLSMRHVCPTVVAAGHDQLAPDEADAMGYEITAIKKVDLKPFNPPNATPFSRIRLEIFAQVRGGNTTDAYGLVPALAYHVSALGILANPIGDEGVMFGHADF